MPSLERIYLSFYTELPVNAMMDGILARIFCPAPGSSDISVEDSTPQPFLPHLQFMECDTYNEYAPFSWDRIPLLCHQGHRRSLMLKIHVKDVDISDEIALQLLQLADEGLDLQINQNSSGHFLENFRKRMCKFSLSTTQRSTLIR
jgi:hypothetical protein